MENFLRSKEYWSLIEDGIAEPAEGAVLTEAQQKRLDEQKLKDLKLKNYLFQAIDRSILETILQKETSKQIWESMKKKYQGSTKVKRAQLQALRRDFETLHMKPEDSVDEYFSKAMAIASKMRLHGRWMMSQSLKKFCVQCCQSLTMLFVQLRKQMTLRKCQLMNSIVHCWCISIN